MREDFERIKQLDVMYLYEHQQEIEQEYFEWQQNQDKLPAKISIHFIKKKKYENSNRMD